MLRDHPELCKIFTNVVEEIFSIKQEYPEVIPQLYNIVKTQDEQLRQIRQNLDAEICDTIKQHFREYAFLYNDAMKTLVSFSPVADEQFVNSLTQHHSDHVEKFKKIKQSGDAVIAKIHHLKQYLQKPIFELLLVNELKPLIILRNKAYPINNFDELTQDMVRNLRRAEYKNHMQVGLEYFKYGEKRLATPLLKEAANLMKEMLSVDRHKTFFVEHYDLLFALSECLHHEKSDYIAETRETLTNLHLSDMKQHLQKRSLSAKKVMDDLEEGSFLQRMQQKQHDLETSIGYNPDRHAEMLWDHNIAIPYLSSRLFYTLACCTEAIFHKEFIPLKKQHGLYKSPTEERIQLSLVNTKFNKATASCKALVDDLCMTGSNLNGKVGGSNSVGHYMLPKQMDQLFYHLIDQYVYYRDTKSEKGTNDILPMMYKLLKKRISIAPDLPITDKPVQFHTDHLSQRQNLANFIGNITIQDLPSLDDLSIALERHILQNPLTREQAVDMQQEIQASEHEAKLLVEEERVTKEALDKATKKFDNHKKRVESKVQKTVTSEGIEENELSRLQKEFDAGNFAEVEKQLEQISPTDVNQESYHLLRERLNIVRTHPLKTTGLVETERDIIHKAYLEYASRTLHGIGEETIGVSEMDIKHRKNIRFDNAETLYRGLSNDTLDNPLIYAEAVLNISSCYHLRALLYAKEATKDPQIADVVLPHFTKALEHAHRALDTITEYMDSELVTPGSKEDMLGKAICMQIESIATTMQNTEDLAKKRKDSSEHQKQLAMIRLGDAWYNNKKVKDGGGVSKETLEYRKIQKASTEITSYCVREGKPQIAELEKLSLIFPEESRRPFTEKLTDINEKTELLVDKVYWTLPLGYNESPVTQCGQMIGHPVLSRTDITPESGVAQMEQNTRQWQKRIAGQGGGAVSLDI